MEDSTRKFPYTLLWFIVIVSPVLTNVAAFRMLTGHDQFAGPLLILGVIGLVFGWVFILVDMIKHDLPNKTFWILSMFFVSFIAEIVYLVRRKKILNISSEAQLVQS